MGAHRLTVRRSRLTRVRAVLAGGLVLGIGAAATLAAWTNAENATGTFGASTFATQSSTVAGVYANNPTAPGAGLVFNATAMSPTVSHYAWLNVRTTAATNVAGTVTLTSSTPAGTLAPVLEYRAVQTGAAVACNATAFTGSPTWITGPTGAYLPAANVAAVPVASALAAAGGETRVCFDVRVTSTAATSYQGATATVTWLFTASSNS
jgi:predicted ribosomally synthesized peptide with SipW-like signal peptide